MGGSKTQTATSEIPGELKPIFQGLGAIGPQLQNTAVGPGGFGQFISGIGAQQIPGLSGAETGTIQNILGLQGQLAGPELGALGQIGNVSQLGNQATPTTNPLERLGIGLLGSSSGITFPEQQAIGQASALNNLAGGGLTGGEQQAFGQAGILGNIAGRTTAPEQEAIRSLQQFTQGNLFESPATQAVLQQLREQTLPELSQDLALRGLNRSGAAEEAFAKARTNALLPVFLQELQQRQQAAGQLAGIGGNIQQRELATRGSLVSQLGSLGNQAAQREASIRSSLIPQLAGIGSQVAGRGLAAGQQLSGIAGQQLARGTENLNRQIATQQSLINPLASIGGSQAQRTRTDLANALEAAGLPRQIAGAQEEANRQELLRRQALQENILLGPLGAQGFIPASFGQNIKSSGGGLFGK